ncbi:MAG: AAA family ATPase [Pseudomonadota bacterium]
MDPVRNPFVPGAGTPPPAFMGRDEVLERARVALGRAQLGRSAKSQLLVGLRGVGKTVLLNRIQELAEADGFSTLFIEAPENKSLPALLVPQLRRMLLALDRAENVNEKVKRALRVLKSFVSGVRLKVDDIELGLEIEAERGAADSGDLEADLPEVFTSLGEAAQARGRAVALIVDEMQYLSELELSALIMAIHRSAQKQLPIVLFGAGLPQLVALSGKSKSYAERLFDFPSIDALGVADAKAALQTPVEREGFAFTDEALMEIYGSTEGYPYFLQEWGYHSWNLAAGSPIDGALAKRAAEVAIRNLDESFFRVRLDRLTPREKHYLRGMAELGKGPHRSGDIAEMLGVQAKSVAPLRSGLIKKGMIFSPAHGDTAFTVPLFDEFMKRTMPTLDR